MPTEVIMPKVDMDMAFGTIAQWYVDEGQSVDKDEVLFDIETDKATMEVEAPAGGTLHYVNANKGDKVPIGEVIGWIFAEGEEVSRPQVAQVQVAEAAEKPSGDNVDSARELPVSGGGALALGIRATPIARRLARQGNIDLSDLQGTGPKGRITRIDVEKALDQPVLPASPKPVSPDTSVAKSTADRLGIAYSEIPVDRMRAIIAERLTESKATVPHFYLDMDCRIDALLQLRGELNAALEAVGSKRLSINDMLIRACALSLVAVPEANASWAGDNIIRYADANVSVAVAVDGGLMTPVIRQAQTKNMQAISMEIADLSSRARAGKLSPDEYQGGSFSISNLGMFGVKSFHAIVNPPESMILAVGSAVSQFLPDDDGQPVAATMLPVSLSCDHRVVDGALGALWLSKFKSLIENPLLLSLGPV